MTSEGLAHSCSTGELCRTVAGHFLRRRWWLYTIASTPCWDSSGLPGSFNLIATDPPACIGFNDSNISAMWAKYVRGSCSNSDPVSGTIYDKTNLPGNVSITSFDEECAEGVNDLSIVFAITDIPPMRICVQYGIPYGVCSGGACTGGSDRGVYCDGNQSPGVTGTCEYNYSTNAMYVIPPVSPPSWIAQCGDAPVDYLSLSVDCDGNVSAGLVMRSFWEAYPLWCEASGVGNTLDIDEFGYPYGDSTIPLFIGALSYGTIDVTAARA